MVERMIPLLPIKIDFNQFDDCTWAWFPIWVNWNQFDHNLSDYAPVAGLGTVRAPPVDYLPDIIMTMFRADNFMGPPEDTEDS